MIENQNHLQEKIDYSMLYDQHPEYAARREKGSYECMRTDVEVRHFKLPNLVRLLHGWTPNSVLEIGCATGELIGNFPVARGAICRGVDISDLNIGSARQKFPNVDFYSGDFQLMEFPLSDVVVLSDVLEHVPDDAGFLASAAGFGCMVLVNLPLECNWFNWGRNYGPEDASGHLRAYTLAEGLGLFVRAGLRLKSWERVWFHETDAERQIRVLKKQYLGASYAGGAFGRTVRRGVYTLGKAVRPIGRRMFSSNLFALAEKS